MNNLIETEIFAWAELNKAKKRFPRPYYMTKKHWITIELNDNLSGEERIDLLKNSYRKMTTNL